MPRTIWSGTVSFGLVTLPVKAFSASRDHDVHFHQLEKGTGARIRYRKVSEATGEEVPAESIERGFEVSSGRYVTVDPDELDLLRPEATHRIDVEAFVDLDDIDPVYFQSTYWLAPDGHGSERAYGLLHAVMQDRRRVGIGRVVMRNRQHLAAVRPFDGALVLSTMRFADEVVDRTAIDGIPEAVDVADRERDLAVQILDALEADWDPGTYRDTYTDGLLELIDRKAKGEELVVSSGAPAEDQGGAVVDLLAVLEASVAASKAAGDSPKAAHHAEGSAKRKSA